MRKEYERGKKKEKRPRKKLRKEKDSEERVNCETVEKGESKWK